MWCLGCSSTPSKRSMHWYAWCSCRTVGQSTVSLDGNIPQCLKHNPIYSISRVFYLDIVVIWSVYADWVYVTRIGWTTQAAMWDAATRHRASGLIMIRALYSPARSHFMVIHVIVRSGRLSSLCLICSPKLAQWCQFSALASYHHKWYPESNLTAVAVMSKPS